MPGMAAGTVLWGHQKNGRLLGRGGVVECWNGSVNPHKGNRWWGEGVWSRDKGNDEVLGFDRPPSLVILGFSRKWIPGGLSRGKSHCWSLSK
jgi:hypothetical protein